MSTPSSFTTLTRAEWEALGGGGQPSGPGPGRHGLIPADEVGAVYAPFSRLLGGRLTKGETFLLGIGGAVSVGKSTTAELLKALLGEHHDVGLLSTDGFLFPNSELEARGLLSRKGSPESYDVARLAQFLTDLRSGVPEVSAPVYSHRTYDIVPDERQVFRSPEVVIIEGVNVLEVIELLDYCVYIDADEADIERWYGQRFVALCQLAQSDPGSFYHHFAGMSTEQIERLAARVWRDVNGPIMAESVLPKRWRADLILEKGPDHAVRLIRMRNR